MKVTRSQLKKIILEEIEDGQKGRTTELSSAISSCLSTLIADKVLIHDLTEQLADELIEMEHKGEVNLPTELAEVDSNFEDVKTQVLKDIFATLGPQLEDVILSALELVAVGDR